MLLGVRWCFATTETESVGPSFTKRSPFVFVVAISGFMKFEGLSG